jgi:hypothetical protein
MPCLDCDVEHGIEDGVALGRLGFRRHALIVPRWGLERSRALTTVGVQIP